MKRIITAQRKFLSTSSKLFLAFLQRRHFLVSSLVVTISVKAQGKSVVQQQTDTHALTVQTERTLKRRPSPLTCPADAPGSQVLMIIILKTNTLGSSMYYHVYTIFVSPSSYRRGFWVLNPSNSESHMQNISTSHQNQGLEGAEWRGEQLRMQVLPTASRAPRMQQQEQDLWAGEQ